MKKNLLQLPEGEDSLTIPKTMWNGYDVAYNFKTKQLDFKPAKAKKLSTYIISEGLINAVNAAIVTGRPLLLKGEPGCGKSKLASAVATYFYGKEAGKHYFEWYVKSKSSAREGGYHFNHLGRLRDATISSNDPQAQKRSKNPENYVHLGPMGMAFRSQPKDGHKPILLIDEIDKGDIDFPNDLLLELDEMRFRIQELDDNFVEADENNRPLVFITSNDERELPPAFLRRCLYYTIPSFKGPLLEKIGNSKIDSFYEEFEAKPPHEIGEEEVKAIVAKFLELKKNTTSVKPPSTSELLDWLKLICYETNQNDKELKTLIADPVLQALALKLF